jgi:Phospholipid methyltransferase
MCESLNTTGAYSVVRHPMYVGNLFIWLGVALFPHKWWLPLMVVLVFWLYYERIMYAEEEFLRSKFRHGYLEWAARTPSFLPNPRLFKKPSLTFSLRTVLRREFSGFFGVIAVFTVLEFVGDLIVERRPVLDPFWMALFVPGVLAYATFFLFKRQTDWLDVEGR